MSAGRNHALPTADNARALWAALLLTTTFLVTETVAGVVVNSLALLADAAHMFADAAALAIASGTPTTSPKCARNKATAEFKRQR